MHIINNENSKIELLQATDIKLGMRSEVIGFQGVFYASIIFYNSTVF